MKCVVQRVSCAALQVDGEETATIGTGLVALLGVTHSDSGDEADWVARRLAALRVFPDAEGRLNRSVLDTGGEVMVVPNFTLYADCSRGRRPGFEAAAPPEVAQPLFEQVCDRLQEQVRVARGVFGAHMHITLTNDGPITLVLERTSPAQVRPDAR